MSPTPGSPSPGSTAEVFVAIRCEELPARFVTLAVDQLSQGLQALLKGVSHGAVRTWATPRRVAVAIADVAPARASEEKLVTGPPAAAAFKDGAPTQTAVGFARGKGVPVESLEIVDGPKGQVIAARVRSGGERTVDLLAEGLEALVTGIKFPMSMRWRASNVRWSRPVHDVVALYGNALVQAELQSLGLRTGRQTLGHRLTPGPIEVDSADSWLSALREHHVEPDREARRASILAQLDELAHGLGVQIHPDPGLVDEVVDLVEWPRAVLCEFDPDLLHLPPRLLVESMRVHQRVFPLWRGEALDHHFVAVSNHPQAGEPETARTIATGNAKVIGARFHDAKFFYAEDRKQRLEAHAAKLTRRQWIRDGGTMADKSARVSALARALAPALEADAAQAARAGALCKADLATQMVGEFPELQGHVGRLLAGFDGEPGHVPLAIEEHYLPRFADDQLPTTAEGRAVALADRLDTLAGCFAVGIRLKGSSDPLGLRRAAIGVLQLQLHAGLRATAEELLLPALQGATPGSRHGGAGEAQDLADLGDFVQSRLRAMLRERFDTEVVDAVLASTGARDAVAVYARVQALATLAATAEFGPIKTTFKRALGLVKDHADDRYSVAAFEAEAERALHAALQAVAPRARAAEEALDYGAALATLSELKAPVDRLFDEVMVMAEDPAVRANRLGLLRAVADEFRRVADLTLLSAE